MRDLSINEFETLMTSRACIGNGKPVEAIGRNEVALRYAIAANKLISDFELENVKAIFRSRRAYIIYKPTGRIACEICIDGEYGESTVRRTRGILMGRKGFIRNKTINELIEETARRGKTSFTNLTKEEIYAKRNQSYRK